MAQKILMTDQLQSTSLHRFHLREEIVGLIRNHGLPLYFLDGFLDGGDAKREVLAASQSVRCDRLAMVAQADVMGRECTDQGELFGRVDLFRDFCQENKCYEAPRQFASDHSRVLFFAGRDLDPDIEVYDDTRLDVVVMSGLPGSGKDRWINRHAGGMPMVSLDVSREAMRVSPDDDQGAVVAAAQEKARGYLRERTPFVWNATNTTLAMRRQLIRHFRDYGARIRITYAETPWADMSRRNHDRENPVPAAVIEKLVSRLDVPDRTEAHNVDYVIS